MSDKKLINSQNQESNSIDGIGITPGIKVDLDSKYAENPSYENDNQLQKAIEYLSKK